MSLRRFTSGKYWCHDTISAIYEEYIITYLYHIILTKLRDIRRVALTESYFRILFPRLLLALDALA